MGEVRSHCAGRSETVTSPIGMMVLYDNGVIVHSLDEGAVVDSESARQIITATHDLAGGRQIAMVVDLRAIGFAHRDAREAFARDPSGGVEVATALVAGPKVADFLASQFIKGAKPDRPTAVFESVGEAMPWASGQVRSARRAE